MADSTIHGLSSQTPVVADELVFYRLSDSTTYKTPVSGLPAMTATVGGIVPTPPNDSTKFLNGQGTFTVPAGGGDMVLASTQINSGLKTFLDTTFGLRNVANTFTSLFTNTNTAARTYTLQDSSDTLVGRATTDTLSNKSISLGSNTVTTTMAQLDTAVSDGNIVYQSQALGTPASGTLTNCTGLPVAGITASTSTALGVGSIELGHATDTSITRVSAGVIAVEGATVPTLTSTSTFSTGIKTFLAGMFALRNVANTFNALFTNTNTADRTITLPDSNTTVPIISQQLTFTGPTAARTITLPDASFTAARTDSAQTFTGTQTFSQQVMTNNAITASANAATVPITSRISTVTNNSAATLTITMTTTSAVDGMLVQVRVLDFSAAAQTITWVNTENGEGTAPTTSNGSTTLPRATLFQYNSATSKWRCIAS